MPLVMMTAAALLLPWVLHPLRGLGPTADANDVGDRNAHAAPLVDFAHDHQQGRRGRNAGIDHCELARALIDEAFEDIAQKT